MPSTSRVGAPCVVASLVLLVASAPAAAAEKRISGKLSKPNYTVIAVGVSGEKAVRAGRGRFRLRLAGPGDAREGVSLHLRGPKGSYAGPIVIDRRKKGKRAVLGVRPGAKLGRIKVRSGYAKLASPLGEEWVDESRVARARKGVPIGARVFGRVRSRPPQDTPPGDSDFDGVPDQLDIDDDGDLILDDVDRSTAARASQQFLEDPAFHNSLELSLSGTVNANAGSTDQLIEQTFLGMLVIGRSNAASTEIDCGRDDPATPQAEGLSYCRPGGNGSIVEPAGQVEPFPECCDSDNDGFGELVNTVAPPFMGGGSTFFVLRSGATTAEIKTGQVVIKRLSDSAGNEVATFSKTLQYVFATVPALISYDDGAGNSGSMSYPVAAGEAPPGPPGGPGTKRNAFPVSPGPDGDVLVTLTLWQPQRRPIDGEPGYSDPPTAWTDIGRLTYSATVETPNDPQTGMFSYKGCPQEAYSAPGQPFTLPPPPGGPGLTHTVSDRPADPGNTVTYTLNLTDCLAGTSWSSGETVGIQLMASGLQVFQDRAPGTAIQNAVYFELQ